MGITQAERHLLIRTRGEAARQCWGVQMDIYNMAFQLMYELTMGKQC